MHHRNDVYAVPQAAAFFLSHSGQSKHAYRTSCGILTVRIGIVFFCGLEVLSLPGSGHQLASGGLKDKQDMPGDGGVSYSMREPYVGAIEAIRRSLASRGLRVVGQLDVTKRVKQSLGIVLAPCSILFVLPLPDALSIASTHPWAASFLPLHIVVSAVGDETRIQVQNKVWLDPDEAEIAIAAALSVIQSRIAEAIGAIARRPSLVV